MILEPGDANREVNVTETFHMQTDDELSEKELKQIEDDDQAIKPFFSVFLKTSMLLLIVVKPLRKSGFKAECRESEWVQCCIECRESVRAEGNAAGQNGNQIRCYNCRGVEEYDLMAAAADLDEIKEVNANCILMANLQQASTSGTHTDSAPVYDFDGSAEVHENCNNNEIFNMFTQEDQYTELLEPIPKPQQVPQNNNNVISEDTSVEQGRETVEQHSANFEETRALYESLY
uniref:Uncharacterized protein n=1 Tax=Tanacetum cinerariifolium TaxID=118510 RepID=A0A699I2G1_TANCI|nr:hypothetical protein [Tanacetum cinerariifolium]